MDRFKSVKLASVLGIIANIFLMIIKGIIGFITNSQAMIADCFNSAGDIFSSFMTFIGNKIASKPYDDDHNLGHGKAEYIYSMLISIVMGAMAAIVLKDSIISIFKKTNYEFSIWLIVVCIITILVKLSLFIYTNKISKKLDNLLLEANSKDHRNDCVVTTLNLISCLLSLAGISFVDGIVGTGIAVWIIITAIDIFKESYDVLMDKSINDDTKNKVFEIINRNQEIKKVTHFNSTPVGYRYQISFSIFVDGNLSTFESHKIADDLEKEIAREIKQVYLSVIHVNPI
ncbi:MAG: cation diffusion facilitator family transporter [Clostridia bacterium]